MKNQSKASLGANQCILFSLHPSDQINIFQQVAGSMKISDTIMSFSIICGSTFLPPPHFTSIFAKSEIFRQNQPKKPLKMIDLLRFSKFYGSHSGLVSLMGIWWLLCCTIILKRFDYFLKRFEVTFYFVQLCQLSTFNRSNTVLKPRGLLFFSIG